MDFTKVRGAGAGRVMVRNNGPLDHGSLDGASLDRLSIGAAAGLADADRMGGASPQAIADVMLQIAHIADSLGYTHGLKPSQWTALRYFAGANNSQRTVSAFADFHATTRGAASQMVEVLVGKGLLVRVPVPEDRRVTHLHPTPKALELLRHDPLQDFAAVIGGLPDDAQYRLAETLTSLLRGLLEKRQST
ncbi:MarR family winged helix-turn-helix transcriptional regulator [Azospirillum sp. B510]|uniref:MarR family winged helix-turn-helix transcriptional regulator n=1 Tax=Azospirillum sp. (strain B510) TaxID=137722 RepID=UPI001FFF9C3C|nr:MarR family winged helix-turn-helix transcriptional regulator [Azospirillum sp. B510]